MSTMPLSVSRPKVHRPPGIGKRKQRKPLPGFLLFWAAVLVVLVAVSLSMKKEPVIKEATTLPPVAVVSNRLPPAEPTGASYAPIADAQAALPPANPAPTLDPNAGTTIRLKDQTGTIVGQMAKIPLENELITEVKATNDVDNGGGRELLSIVSKY